MNIYKRNWSLWWEQRRFQDVTSLTQDPLGSNPIYNMVWPWASYLAGLSLFRVVLTLMGAVRHRGSSAHMATAPLIHSPYSTFLK